jgi:hypothetical protein
MKKFCMISIIIVFLFSVFIYFLPIWAIGKSGQNIEIIKKDLLAGYTLLKRHETEKMIIVSEYESRLEKLNRLWADTIEAEGEFEKCKICEDFDKKLDCANRLVKCVNKILDSKEQLADEFQASKIKIIETLNDKTKI